MSGFVDFVAANRDEAKAILRHHKPTENWPGFEWKWVDNLVLGYLHGLLTGAEDRYATCAGFEEFGWRGPASLHALPPDLVRRLATLLDQDVQAAAENWRRCPEFHRSDDLPGAIELLESLRAVCQRALREEKIVFVRQSGAY